MRRRESPAIQLDLSRPPAHPGKRMPSLKFLTMALLSCLVFSSLLALRFARFSRLDPGSIALSRRAIPSHWQNPPQGDRQGMDGLLAPRDREDRCHSRSRHHLYRQASRFKPSKYLVSKLRQYEALHQRCAPEAEKSRQDGGGGSSCQFLVWVSYSGLGNKLVTLAATFLYALLTDRVLLVDPGVDLEELLCEPFPGSSWLLPSSFPREWLRGLNESSQHRFGSIVRDAGKCVPDASHLIAAPGKVYIHLTHTYDEQDRRFFCEGEQEFLRKVPWLFIKSNNYFVPSFYFMPTFRAELERMFPEREAVFHHLGRYLLHPSNSVWARTTRYYESYLGGAELLVGLQLRTFEGSIEAFSNQVLECVVENKMLPNVTRDDEASRLIGGGEDKSISVLITSLHQIYYERLRDMYVMFPTEDLSRVKVHLPSHEGVQKTDTSEHDKKALMEIFLLSFCDTLVTSPMSTFGYVAQGLAGLRPRVLRRLEDDPTQPACSSVLSVDPCFHAPPLYDCDCKGGRDPGKVLDAVKHCQDVKWGIQLVNNPSDE
ncbi:galactoside 2-alpha-L-fucosyltransferase-like [Selaginella moellendorffii]|uniref:galactoside 2-alpha-L-fucosyltransferase-like n=1 Tax=Selaginella moellendorffii TaxID=88036 RepID=UPI000D1C537A|nr:galactoside 2-alpha-L-fucosyltransferase-like [Selaginella moellendorffii]XP_024518516.1 galactoside 2-alpha-L-fucosyltransferase-like [Selaginella moellendorffii]|eukprot:XP_024518471.1 galactoside 2-alpha-L-fucosyltransferase-like [Selaginella moellendorffii]